MVGLLIITHNKVGEAVFEAATSVLGSCPMPYALLNVSQDCEPEERLKRAQKEVDKLNQGDGVLVVTDMYGSTPSNVATKLAADDVTIITGVNLPMMVRIMNYSDLPLHKLANKALSGGKAGVLIFEN
ncbi:MAG: PTS fructose transporter subunit IIA [Gammaproteobacteria bacterium]|nr:PTS fructose transporter subunit IIA [Gammaproteobacteria bacterium]